MSTPAPASGWDWLDPAGGNNRPPAAVVALPPRPRPAPTLLVVGAAGGAGVSVLSVLLADGRAAAGQHAIWIAPATIGDAAARIAGGDTADTVPGSVSGAELLTGHQQSAAALIDSAAPGACIVIDAGTLDDPAGWPQDVSVVLVIAARPDTANRSKVALATLAEEGLLSDATVVVACLDPWAADQIGHRLTDALSDRVGRVLLWDYDPHLGTGGRIDPPQLAASTTGLLTQLDPREDSETIEGQS